MALLTVSACSNDARETPDLGAPLPDFARDVGEGADASGMSTDTGLSDAAVIDAASLGDMATDCEPLPAPPTEVVTPTAGELYYEQVGLGGFAPGEAAIIVGADGTVTVFDVGNDSHVDDVVDRLDALQLSTVDHIVVTHYHADHGDGLSELVDEVGIAGRFVFRGLTDLTDAANSSTYDETADVASALGAQALPLCDTIACDNLGETLGQGASTLRFVGANATMAGERYEQLVGPLLTDDGNGENARSVVAAVEHGAFRMLLTGDLTGGGSDTDDVESFYAARLDQVSDIDAAGIDVLHAGHHGRNTSTNATWAARLLPADGSARNVVMGISTVHANSPHDEVLEILEPALGDGWMWTTRIATLGAESPRLVSADGGHIVIATIRGGDAYVVQAVGDDGGVRESRVFRSVRGCR